MHKSPRKTRSSGHRLFILYYLFIYLFFFWEGGHCTPNISQIVPRKFERRGMVCKTTGSLICAYYSSFIINSFLVVHMHIYCIYFLMELRNIHLYCPLFLNSLIIFTQKKIIQDNTKD